MIAALAMGQTHAGPRDLLTRLRGPRVAAHRGGYGLPDSNTVARFETARRQGVDIVETDLRVSSDGVVFLFHNPLLDRVTSCTGPIASHTAAEIAQCHLIGLDHGPDTFESALRWSGGRVVIDAELKTGAVTEPAIDLVRRYDAFDWVYFQVGVGLRTYQRVRDYDERVAVEAAPHGPKGQLWLAELLAKHDPNLLIIQLHPDFLSSEIQSAIRDAGKLSSINAWRLAPEAEAANCTAVFARGIDISVTNAAESCTKQRDEVRAAQAGRRESPGVTRGSRSPAEPGA